MKKKILLFMLCVVLLLGITGCGSKEKIYNIGDTIETKMFSFTIKSVEFVDGINCQSEKSSAIGYVAKEDFFVPTTEKGKNILVAGDGYKMLYFTAEYEFNGKQSVELSPNTLFKPKVLYEDYTIDTNYIVFYKPKSWYLLATDLNYNTQKSFNIDLSYYEVTYEPLENKTYEVRGTISIPEKIESDIKSEVILDLALFDRIEDNNNYIFENYKVKVR